jgi:hypothetical protein
MNKEIPEEFIKKVETVFPDNKVAEMFRAGLIVQARMKLEALCNQPVMTKKEMLEAIDNNELAPVKLTLKMGIEYENLLLELDELTKNDDEKH